MNDLELQDTIKLDKKWQYKALDKMLKEHHISYTQFNEIVEKSTYNYNKYVDLALEYNAPLGMTWKECRTKLYDYKDELYQKSINSDITTITEWYDLMWFTAEEMEDEEAIDFIFRLEYKEWQELRDETRADFKVIIQRQIDYNKVRINIYEEKIAFVKERFREYELFKKRDTTIKATGYHRKQWDENNILSKLLPPPNCPSILPTENWNGSQYQLVVYLRDEMRMGGHKWCNMHLPSLIRWASYKYTIDGRIVTQEQLMASFIRKNNI